MTEAKTTALTGEEFKTLAITNVVQLQNWLQNIPPHVEGGGSGMTPESMALVDQHIDRFRMWLRSWSLTRIEVPPQAAQPHAAPSNGVEPAPKRRGGWPAGKKRTRVQPGAPQ